MTLRDRLGFDAGSRKLEEALEWRRQARGAREVGGLSRAKEVLRSGLKITHRRRERLELGAPGDGRRHRPDDELREADGDESLHELA